MKTLAFCLTVGLCAAPALGQLTIERIAPENSVMIVGVPNVQLTQERFQRTALYDLWNSEEMKQFREDDMTGLAEEFYTFLDELGVNRDELSMPTGAMGFAMFPVIDEELGQAAPGMIAFADFGDTAAAMGAMMLAMLDRGDQDGVLEYEVKDILGRSVYEVRMIADDIDEDEFDFDAFNMMPSPQDFIGDLDRMYYVHDGSMLMLCSDLGSITETLDRIDGNVRGTLADRDDFQGIMNQIGRDDFYFAVLTRDMMEIAMAADEMGMLMFVTPTLKELFGDIRGFGMGARFDGADAMFEGRWSVYMPAGKRGLTRLMDLSSPRGGIPAFVGPDTLNYGSMNFRFDQVASVIRSVVRSNPLIEMQAEEMMEMVDGPLTEILNTLGSQVHTAMSITRPVTLESMSFLMAVEARDAQGFENIFGQFAPEMGMEPRDFLGQRIYSMDMGGMVDGGMDSMSVGIGGNHVFLGPTPAVEQALRTVSDPDMAITLAEEPGFRDAERLFSQGDLVGWQYVNLIEMLDAMGEFSELQQQAFIDQIAEANPEWAEEMREEGIEQPMDFDLLRRHIGAMISELRSTDDGFVGTMFLLTPSE